jgi:hypothetical protein
MGVSLEIYRAAIGVLNRRVFTIHKKLTNLSLLLICKSLVNGVILYLILCILLMVAGDIETNPGPPRNLTLNMGHINARSLNIEDKFDEICCLVHNVNLDILAVSETWLNDSISSDSLNIQGFALIIRLDRQNGRRAGGVALYISSSIAYRRRFDLENCEFELLFVEFKICNTNFVCAVCYRPPNYSAIMNSAFLTHLQNCLDRNV